MTKKRILPPDRMAECEAAHALFLSKKNDLKLSQKKIADAAGMTPAAVNLYFKGINPLNAQFAAVLAGMLDEPVERFSPRLAEEIRNLTKAPVSRDSGERMASSATAADLVNQMLANSGKNISEEVRKRLIAAADESPGKAAPYRAGQVGDEVWIAHYDVRAAMGGGQVAHDYPEMLQDVRVSPKHLREIGVEFKEHFHLKMVTGWGQSMAPTIKHRDPLLVDVTVREFVGDGIYLFSHGDLLYIKRLQKKGREHFKMVSDNTNHPAEDIRVDETHIQARVLYVWNGNLV